MLKVLLPFWSFFSLQLNPYPEKRIFFRGEKEKFVEWFSQSAPGAPGPPTPSVGGRWARDFPLPPSNQRRERERRKITTIPDTFGIVPPQPLLGSICGTSVCQVCHSWNHPPHCRHAYVVTKRLLIRCVFRWALNRSSLVISFRSIGRPFQIGAILLI